ncbi:molecular chaperone (small heat shock protein) [Caldisphaera lagunensis DSM 15908]|uniref:Molecular chaperone (Small heat shock protein) n=1 Tax=Caldisphaera lagunensis (strain DSM 15908 / JCM 11604 / ANMR 0165 / IC-154) TaxID=1056495 RepID=L0ACZ1_CALLD|nr:archaeal heat shock protein Hsp20 [Caldisphaera lagunensis]AFZ71007.1 molecular chaperone (small heat shock protein) [Caldisphaera lagunensis DSM 15908]
MSNNPKKRKSIFDIFDDIMREMEEEMREFEESFEDLMKQQNVKGENPYYYGVRIFVGPDGVPKVEEFGNIKKGKYGKPIISDEIEPIVDVIDHNDEIWIVADLPGVAKENIKVNATEDKIYIKANSDIRKYSKEIDLPSKIDPDSVKASYKNGVLEIKVKKKNEEPKGKEIKIE